MKFKQCILFAMLIALLAVRSAYAEERDDVVYIQINSGSNVLAQGSGFLVSAQGFIVTARHVVESASAANTQMRVALRSRNAAPVPASIFDCGPVSGIPDACLIKINADDVKEKNITNLSKLGCRNLSVGENLKARGYGSDPSSTLMEVSGAVLGGLGGGFLYPSSLTISPGMSGGPVYDSSGLIVGILKGAQMGAPHLSFFTPLVQMKARLLSANADCN